MFVIFTDCHIALHICANLVQVMLSFQSSNLLPDGSTARMPAADSVEVQSTKQKLKEECQHLWQELKQVLAIPKNIADNYIIAHRNVS